MRVSRRGLSSLNIKLPGAFKVHPGLSPEFTGPRDYAEVTGEELKEFLRSMVKIRRMEVVSGQMYTMKKIRGFCHLYVGQEAVAVGAEASMTWEDSVITAYRDHAWFLTRGGTVQECIAEMMGKQGGCSKGKGGSMHLYKEENNFYGGNGIVGAQCPVGAGIALQHCYDDPKNPTGICLTLYGDGAANQGQLYEAMNLAKIWNLPVVFACENNQFGMGTSRERACANPDFYKHVSWMPGLLINGMDVLAVREGMRYCKEWCLAGNGPIQVEFDTYRYVGHSMSDPGVSYRTREDVAAVRAARDPIMAVKKYIVDAGVATEAELKALEKTVNKATDAEIAEGEAFPDTKWDERFTDVFSDTHPHAPVRAVDINA